MNDRVPKVGKRSLPEALSLAMQYHQKGQLQQAEKLYLGVLKAVPNHPDALHYLGVLSHQSGRADRAVQLIRRAIELQPDYLEARNNLGNVLKEQGMLKEAEAQYRKVIEGRPAFADAHNNLGVVLKSLERYDEAEAAYRQAVALEPQHPDAWYNLGLALDSQNKHDDALTAYRTAILIKPRHGQAYKELGMALYAAGRGKEAIEIYRQWLEQDPGNPVAEHMLAACSGEAVPNRATDSYVQQTFDGFAATFDQNLARLGYQAPALVAGAVGRVFGQPRADLIVLDAGCGTGLCGRDLEPFARSLIGVDLSPGMLTKAKQLAVYDDLVAAELTDFLGKRPGAYDLIVSADTLCYFGALEVLLGTAASALRDDGWLIFTVEYADEKDVPHGFRINPHGRYSHSESYVRESLAAAGFSVNAVTQETLRMESRQPVVGLLVAAAKGQSSPAG